MSGAIGGMVGAVAATYLVSSGAITVTGLFVVCGTIFGVLAVSVGLLLAFDQWGRK